MEQGQPSKTALGAARLRAAHQVLDHPKVLDDPVALRIVDREAVAALHHSPERFQTPRLRYLRAHMVMRSRYTEDRLTAAVARGVDQYVILGAGLDTFAYRSPFAETALRVFEMDHPATQAWKRARLAEGEIRIPSSVTFVPVDFERETLAEALARAGFRTDHATFLSWLGVTMYLTREPIMRTLEWVVTTMPPGSEIVFSYAVAPTAATSTVASRAAELGEPWVTYFEPATLKRDLAQLGFRQLDDFGPAEQNERYFAGRTDGLCISGTGRLMAARVSPA